MNAFFHSTELRLALRRAAEAWRGTPWMAYSCLKGRGVSCHQLCCALYTETGLFAAMPVIPLRGFSSRHAANAAAWLNGQPEFMPCDGPILAGDLIVLASERLHFAIALPDKAGSETSVEIVQSLGYEGVNFHSLFDSAVMRARYGVWRPVLR